MTDPIRWVGKLGAPNQWRNVPYVEDKGNGLVMCKLCATKWMHKRSCGPHFNGEQHAENFKRVRLYEEEMNRKEREEINRKERLVKLADDVQSLRSMEPAVSSLGSRVWTDAVKARMLDWILTAHQDDSVSRGEKFQSLHILLQQFLKKEVCTLLELALWKATIADKVVFDSVREAREYVTFDEAFDSREFFRNARITSGAETIIPLVVSFLLDDDNSTAAIWFEDIGRVPAPFR